MYYNFVLYLFGSKVYYFTNLNIFLLKPKGDLIRAEDTVEEVDHVVAAIRGVGKCVSSQFSCGAF